MMLHGSIIPVRNFYDFNGQLPVNRNVRNVCLQNVVRNS